MKIIAKDNFEVMRLKRGLTVRKLAAKANLDPGTVNSAGNGKSITLTTATKLRVALDCEFADIFEIENNFC